MIIDNFALSMHQQCPRLYQHRMKQRWVSRGGRAPLVAGAAIHAGMAEWYRSGSSSLMAQAAASEWHKRPPLTADSDWRTLAKVQTTLLQYIAHYPDESFGIIGHGTDNPIIEKAFTLDTGLVCDDGEPIEYGGILDTAVEFADDFYVLEHKTTSVFGAGFWDQFKPNNQIAGYIWAARRLSDKPVRGAIVNAIAWYRVGATKFDRSITTRTDSELAEWERNLVVVCNEIRQHEAHGYYPQRTASCTIYGRCSFLGVCAQEPDVREVLLEQEYEQDEWDHATRDEK